MGVRVFGETPYTWYYVLVCMSCYAVGEIGHFIIGIVSKPLAQDIEFGDKGCISNSSAYNVSEKCTDANYTRCMSLKNQNESYCEWNYLGSGIEYQLLAGPCFIAIFTVTGIIIGVLGDVYNRVRLLSTCVCFYSLMAFLTGWATEYWQLVLLRFGFGAGEAACTPLTSSIVADKFGSQSRGLGMSVFNWGIYIGYGLAFTIGNYVPKSELFNQSWRWAYYLIGIPGFFLAAVLFFTVKEPQRKAIGNNTEKQQENEDAASTLINQPVDNALDKEIETKHTPRKPLSTLWFAIKTFALSPALLVLLLAASIRHTASFCWAYNTQLYFDHYYPGTDLGFWMTLCSIIGGLIGIASGGLISDKVVSKFGVTSRLWVLVISQSIAAPLAALVLYLSPPYCFIALLSAYLFAEMWFGVALTVIVEKVPMHIRSTAVALSAFVISNVGGNAPVAVTSLKGAVGGLRNALYIMYAGFYLLSAVFFLFAQLLMRREKVNKAEESVESIQKNDVVACDS
uniref:Uncharacterized protein LOC100183908 n=1 Tax=Phallusia mammillata TaxID=59560 RepID=A0A6F9DI04_9ASCI|nr:uncharacterized protein LOC100183908 [Phallusia mammillata]